MKYRNATFFQNFLAGIFHHEKSTKLETHKFPGWKLLQLLKPPTHPPIMEVENHPDLKETILLVLPHSPLPKSLSCVLMAHVEPERNLWDKHLRRMVTTR